MGILDVATPLFEWLDQALAGLVPVFWRLVLWGAIAAIVSMSLYALLSPQRRLRRVREEAVEARRALDLHDGSLAAARPLIGRMFATSMKQLALVFLPAVVASLPILFLLVWLSNAFTYVPFEEAGKVSLKTDPPGYKAEVLQAEVESSSGLEVRGDHYLAVRDGRGRVVVERRLTAPVATLHKKQWWNGLIANPLGYLDAGSPIENVTIGLPRREVLDVGPWWMRTWEFVFLTTLVVVSLTIKLAFRLV